MKYLDENGLLYFYQKIKTWLTGKVDKVDGKGLSTNDYTTVEKNKLAGLENYSLPTASTETLGGVKVGAGLAINEGVLSATGGGTADSVDWSNVQNKPTNVSDFTNDVGYQTASDVDDKGDELIQYITDQNYQNKNQVENIITSKGYQTSAQVENAITSKGYQTSAQVETAITVKGYQTAADVNVIVEGVVGAAPDALDTLKELADALGNDANFAATITNELAKKVNTSDVVAITNAEIDTICAS